MNHDMPIQGTLYFFSCEYVKRNRNIYLLIFFKEVINSFSRLRSFSKQAKKLRSVGQVCDKKTYPSANVVTGKAGPLPQYGSFISQNIFRVFLRIFPYHRKHFHTLDLKLDFPTGLIFLVGPAKKEPPCSRNATKFPSTLQCLKSCSQTD